MIAVQDHKLTFDDAVNVYHILGHCSQPTEPKSLRLPDGWLLQNENGPVARVRVVNGIAYAFTEGLQ